jgi:hypothetical protein
MSQGNNTLKNGNSKKAKVSVNRKVKNATPLTYNGIKFRSRLEVFCYKSLIKHNIKADYEKYKFTLLDSFRFNDESVRKMTYTPDFVGEEFVIECKGFSNDAFPLRWKLFKHFLFTNNIQYDLYLPRNQKQVIEVIEAILSKREEKRKELLQEESNI